MSRSFLILLSAVLLLSGCMKDTVSESYTIFRPVYETRAELRANIKSDAPRAIVQTGKIVVKDHYLFLNELDKGIHVIDIADPSKPVNLSFIEIPGCMDLAVNGNYLYADCYVDLVTIDITSPSNVVLKEHIGGVFPKRQYYGFVPDSTKVIRNWVRTDTTITKNFSGGFDNTPFLGGVFFLSSALPFSSASFSSGGAAVAGSMARFALQNQRMYTVSNDDLKVFNTSIPQSPAFVKTIDLPDGNIETIFPYKNKLFIGAQAGMYIYDAANPDNPGKLGKFTHARSCDPVVADDQFAFVTLSGGNICGGFSNQLDIININNLSSPSLVRTYPLTSPKGLSKDGNILLICDGKDGLKIFDATQLPSVSLIQKISGFDATDVIAINGIAVTVAKDGIYLINYATPASAAVIGKILVSQTQ